MIKNISICGADIDVHRKIELARISKVDEQLDELSDALRVRINEELEEYGLILSEFFVEQIKMPDEDEGFQQLKRQHAEMDLKPREEALSMLQSLDMGKIGFIQDLMHGIGKILRSTAPDTTVSTPAQPNAVSASAAAGVESLQKRMMLFLEDGDFTSATQYADRILDIDPEYAPAYLGKLMAELKVQKEPDLAQCEAPISENSHFQKALRFANEAYSAVLTGYNQTIIDRIENERKESIYDDALGVMHSCDVDEDMGEFVLKAGSAKVSDIYRMMDNATERSESLLLKIETLQDAREKFISIQGYKDADVMVQDCQRREEIAKSVTLRLDECIQSMRARIAKYEQIAAVKKARGRKIAIFGSVAAAVVVIAIVLLVTIILPSGYYGQGQKHLAAREYDAALRAFQAAGNYKDAATDKVPSIHYDKGQKHLANSEYDAALAEFKAAGNYKDSASKKEIIPKERLKARGLDVNSFGGYRWKILKEQEGKVLIITEDCVAQMLYHESFESITWEKCTLRKWLNGAFYDSLPDNVKSKIVETIVKNPKNAQYGTDGGSDTNDKVFLLSIDEANSLFPDDASRVAKYESQACWWWLRSPGFNSGNAATVDYAGHVYDIGDIVDLDGGRGVRPACWVKID